MDLILKPMDAAIVRAVLTGYLVNCRMAPDSTFREVNTELLERAVEIMGNGLSYDPPC